MSPTIRPPSASSFNLVDKDGYLTNAGVLLADQNIYTHSRIFCTHWNGLTKTSTNGEAVDDVVASERRNPVLADIFARMKFMERRGSGLKKITDNTNALFNDDKNHVEFFSGRNFFKVTIHNALYGKKQKNTIVNASVNANVNASVKLSTTQEAIIQLMRGNPQITIKEMASTLGKNETTISLNIKELKKKDIVKRVGSDKAGRWALLIG